MNFKIGSDVNFITFLKENITLILLGLYSLSFINYYLYYKGFEISIFNYVGINDMLFFSLEYIFNIILLIIICEIILFMIFSILYTIYEKFILFVIKNKFILYLNSNKRQREKIDKVLNKKFNNSLLDFRFTIVLLSVFAIPFLPHKLILSTTLMIYLIYYISKFSKEKMFEITFIMSSAIIIISTITTTLVNSYEKRFEKSDFEISFYENSKLITTAPKLSCLNYLGETSSNIFLYDIENKESKIYFKDNLSDIKIKNTNNIDNTIIKIKENFIVKVYLEMLSEK